MVGTSMSPMLPNEEPTPPTREPPRKSEKARGRGFAAMTPERLRKIARRGGKAAHEAGTAHEFTSEEARVAGRKGARAHRERRGDTDPTW